MATTTTTTEAATEVAHGAAKAGMPQLDPTHFANQIFWLVVTLLVIFFVLKLVALPRIAGTLAIRRGTIINDLAAAEELKQKVFAAEQAYNDALVSARAEAGKIVTAAKADIQADLNKAIAKADAQIAAKATESAGRIDEIRAGAQAAISEVAKDTAKELVSALGGTADARSITAAVTARLKG
ncbi:F0F1 ATP synthase subunit B' [Cypionkella sp.]|uniref:F0F1 ATP synthase subunit B' n=1 Tax=Cypionkella sp. TaxID=2811411 RepID=UPI002727E997|nr:F0F1 ATP synthase subunit B' [Cypionkella sp.]MDO8983373.1 F0F1 ATP synthase subunit B' [Cypionkella sp.]MDP2050217.1 F0F1 ATP synthase subunit B' [Cypionkella sp.]